MPQEDQVTLYLTGLPPDVTEREVYLLFVTIPGFKHGMLKFSTEGKGPMAFITFDNHENAEIARQATDGLVFDLSVQRKLKVVISTNTSRIEREDKFVGSNRVGVKNDLESDFFEAARKLQSHEAIIKNRHEPYPSAQVGRGRGSGRPPSNDGRGAPHRGVGLPCPTLFIVDKSRKGIPEHILDGLVENMQGLKSRHIKGSNAWLNFESTADAYAGLSLNGWIGSGIGPLHVEYSRSNKN